MLRLSFLLLCMLFAVSLKAQLVHDFSKTKTEYFSHKEKVVASNDKGFFILVNQLDFGNELSFIDGKTKEITHLADISIGPSSPNISYSDNAVIDNNFYFTADDNVHGAELWVSDGTKEGTKLFADIIPGPVASKPVFLYSSDSLFYLVIEVNGYNQVVLYNIYTKAVKTLFTEPINSGSSYVWATKAGEAFIFSINGNTYKSFGSLSSTSLLINKACKELVEVKGEFYVMDLKRDVYLVQYDDVNGKLITDSVLNYSYKMFNYNNKLLILSHGYFLYEGDGTIWKKFNFNSNKRFLDDDESTWSIVDGVIFNSKKNSIELLNLTAMGLSSIYYHGTGAKRYIRKVGEYYLLSPFLLDVGSGFSTSELQIIKPVFSTEIELRSVMKFDARSLFAISNHSMIFSSYSKKLQFINFPDLTITEIDNRLTHGNSSHPKIVFINDEVIIVWMHSALYAHNRTSKQDRFLMSLPKNYDGGILKPVYFNNKIYYGQYANGGYVLMQYDYKSDQRSFVLGQNNEQITISPTLFVHDNKLFFARVPDYNIRSYSLSVLDSNAQVSEFTPNLSKPVPFFINNELYASSGNNAISNYYKISKSGISTQLTFDTENSVTYNNRNITVINHSFYYILNDQNKRVYQLIKVDTKNNKVTKLAQGPFNLNNEATPSHKIPQIFGFKDKIVVAGGGQVVVYDTTGKSLVNVVNKLKAEAYTEFYCSENNFYFAAKTSNNVIEPWLCDGTTAGTVHINQIAPGLDITNPSSFYAIGDTVVFAAANRQVGTEMFRYIESANQLDLVADYNPGSIGSYPSDMTYYKGQVYFTGFQHNTGTQLHKLRISACAIQPKIVSSINCIGLLNATVQNTIDIDTMFWKVNDSAFFSANWLQMNLSKSQNTIKFYATSNRGCKGVDSIMASYHPELNGSFLNFKGDTCSLNGELNFSTTSTDVDWKYDWLIDGQKFNTNKVDYLQDGTQSIKASIRIRDTVRGCVYSDSIAVNINSFRGYGIKEMEYKYCSGDSMLVSLEGDNKHNYGITWLFNSDTIKNSLSFIPSNLKEGINTVELMVSNASCSTVFKDSIKYYQSPQKPTVTGKQQVGQFSAYEYAASNTTKGVLYFWDLSNGINITPLETDTTVVIQWWVGGEDTLIARPIKYFDDYACAGPVGKLPINIKEKLSNSIDDQTSKTAIKIYATANSGFVIEQTSLDANRYEISDLSGRILKSGTLNQLKQQGYLNSFKGIVIISLYNNDGISAQHKLFIQ